MNQHTYTQKLEGDMVEITESSDRWWTDYTVRGRLIPVTAFVQQIYDQYPSPGYGTWMRMTGLDLDTQMVTVEIRHSNSCD